ncbi:MAG: hypothetical protein JXR23_04690 [Pontiellaceae bacterium]|nr:hypothetical protein [Pontiellaceae bacterium]
MMYNSNSIKAALGVSFVIFQSVCTADFATPFVEINNRDGDVSECFGYLSATEADLGTNFMVIVTTDCMEPVVLDAVAQPGLVTPSDVGRWVQFTAEIIRSGSEEAGPLLNILRIGDGRSNEDVAIPWGKVSNGLQCRLLPAAKKVEPSSGGFRDVLVYVTFELRNVSCRPIQFLPWYTPLEDLASGSTFHVVDEQGNAVPYLGVNGSRVPPSGQSFITILPRTTLSHRVGLTYNFSTPGIYRIAASPINQGLENLSFYYGDDAPEIEKNSDNVWTGKLDSNEIVVEIVPSNGPWGEPSRQGLSLRLQRGAHADTLVLDLANKGYAAWMASASLRFFQLEVDGIRYINGRSVAPPDTLLEPGQVLKGIAIPLRGEWSGAEWPKEPLTLPPGEHAIRVICGVETVDKNEEQSVLIISNTVMVKFID